MAAPPSLPINGTPTEQIARDLGTSPPSTTDPAFQPPTDPLKDRALGAVASVVHRDIPIVTVATGWEPATVRIAFGQLVTGVFDLAAQLTDSVTGDSRVQAALASRVGGLLGRPVEFQIPRKFKDDPRAQECRDAFEDAWPTMAAESFLAELQTWAVMMGFGVGQLLWDTSGEYAIPHPRIWHPRFMYYHWTFRRYIAVTQDSQVAIEPGNGTWVLHAPHGDYRGWMRGALRAIGPWWLGRNYALRDLMRWSERHGFPIVLAMTPAAGDPKMIEQFRAAVMNLGQESAVSLPQGNDKQFSYGLDLLEAKVLSWEGFLGLIGACDREITLALLAQNLTTEVKEGSYAAARVHADVRQALLEADARALTSTIYNQLARPFAQFNFGDPDLAPRAVWNVKPYEDDQTAAQTMLTITQAIVNLANGGHAVDDPAWLARQFGIDLGKLTKVQAAIAGSAPPPEKASARFAALAAHHMRLRIDAGVPEDQIRAENEAIEAMLAEGEATRATKQRTRRAKR